VPGTTDLSFHPSPTQANEVQGTDPMVIRGLSRLPLRESSALWKEGLAPTVVVGLLRRADLERQRAEAAQARRMERWETLRWAGLG
jgi:hypothetical protein